MATWLRERAPVGIRVADESDAIEMAPRTRPGDVIEAEALGITVLDGLLVAIREPDSASYAAVDNSGVIALFGVCPGMHRGIGAPWLIATPVVKAYPITLAREAMLFRDIWLDRFKTLSNWVMDDNLDAVKFLEWLGFEFDFSVNLGSAKFRHFWQRRSH